MKVIREYKIDEEKKNKVKGTQGFQYIEKKVDDMFIVTKIYFFEKGKTTLKGDYPKFKENKDCKYPERLDCNSGPGYERCEHMYYDNLESPFSDNRWKCKYNKK